jgi:hypothetical protein
MGNKARLFGTLMAVAQLMACEGMDPVAPSDQGSAVNPAAAPVIVTVAPIFEFPPGSGSGVSGEATLTRTSEGLWLDQDLAGLIPGNAYTVWWVIFDNPQGCDADCDPSDLSRRQAQPSLVNGGGFVAGGTTQFYSSHLARHDVEGRQVQLGDPSGVDNTYGAQVHVVLRSHGTAVMDPADQAEQTSTFNGFCNPVCANVSAAVFLTPEAPGQGS